LISVGVGVCDGRRVGGGSGVRLGRGVESFNCVVGGTCVGLVVGAAPQATRIQVIKMAKDILGKNIRKPIV